MVFLKRKAPESKTEPVKVKSLREIVTERVLTAEGWRRRHLKKTKKAK